MGLLDKIFPDKSRPIEDQAAETEDKQKEEALAAWIKNKVDEIRSGASRVAHEGIWMQNTASVLGFSGLFWNSSARAFAPVNRAAGSVKRNRIHVNKLLPNLQNRLARLCKNQPRYDVKPNDSTQEAKDNARFKLDILTAKWNDMRISQKRPQLLMWVQQTGHAYLGVFWDDIAGKIMFNPETGKEDFEGDVRIDVISPFEVYPDPVAKSFDEAQFFIRAKVRPLAYFKSHYGDVGAEVKAEETWLLSAQFESRINSMNTRGPAAGTVDSNQQTAIELTYFERPCREYPRGRLCVVANKIMLMNGELPTGKLPIVKFDDIVVGGKYYSECVTTHARPIQDQYNQVIRRRADWVNKLLTGKYISPRGNELIREALTDEQGEIIQYTPVPNAPGGGEPKALDIPDIPQWAYTEEDRLDQQFSEIMGLGEASQGNIPSANVPGVALQLMIEQDSTRIGTEIEQHEHAFADVGTLILDLIQKNYIAPRKMKFAGKNSYVIKDIQGDDLVGDNDVTVVRGSMNPDSKTLRRQELLNLYDRGLLGDPADPKVRQNLMADLEYGDLSEPYIDIAITQNRLKKEIESIEQGIYPDIDESDDHAEAYKELCRYRKSDKYEQLDPSLQQLFLQVRQAHLDKLLESSGVKQPDATPEMHANAQMAAESAGDMPQEQNPDQTGESMQLQQGAI